MSHIIISFDDTSADWYSMNGARIERRWPEQTQAGLLRAAAWGARLDLTLACVELLGECPVDCSPGGSPFTPAHCHLGAMSANRGGEG